jgi:glycosyltransferase involved in cell wall biosynthesis
VASEREENQMKKTTRVSVIVPVYNVEKFLKKCLDCLVQQTMEEIEIICINDGSTDGSASILAEYAAMDSRIVVLTQENRGLSVARNNGMAAAGGEFIGFVDGDDWVALNYFEKLYAVAKKHDADIACCGFSRVYSSRSKTKLNIYAEGVFETTDDKYRITNTPGACYVFNKIYNREKLNELQLQFESGIFFEDVSFTIRVLYYMKKLAVTPETNYYYRANIDSITRGERTDKKQLDIIRARKDFIQFAHEHHIRRDDKYFVRYKIFHKCLGILLMKIYVWKTIRKYYLFGIIKVWETRKDL